MKPPSRMDTRKVDHILRAAGAVTGQMRFGLVGSAAIFAWRTDVPEEMALTREADLFACDVDAETAERIADELDASLGRASPFDEPTATIAMGSVLRPPPCRATG
jgi:hypothetical protein